MRMQWSTLICTIFIPEENYPKKLDNIPVTAANDANVAALGEMWMGGGQGCRDLIMVTLGTGVGGGIIVKGKMLTGFTGAGGEIGHMHVEDREEETCNCGNKGCLEQYSSATGITRLANRLWHPATGTACCDRERFRPRRCLTQ